LHALGFSVGDVATGGRWIVTGSDGTHEITAAADTQGEAWRLAAEQAEAIPTVIVEARP
jgi:hypothetical protein